MTFKQITELCIPSRTTAMTVWFEVKIWPVIADNWFVWDVPSYPMHGRELTKDLSVTERTRPARRLQNASSN